MFNPSPNIKLGKEIQLLIGVNGSGKSTVLEAIAILFSQVKEYCENPQRRERQFNFSIEYSFTLEEIKGKSSIPNEVSSAIKHVILSSSKETPLEYAMYVDKEEILTTQRMYKYLPDNLIFYYAGACNTLEQIIDKTEDEQASNLFNLTNEKNLSRVIDSITKNIIYIREDYYPLLFALNYIEKEQKLPITNKNFTIKSIRFFIKQYRYTKNTDYKNLYNLTGFLRNYIDNLLKHSYGIDYDDENNIAFFDVDFHKGILEAIEELPNLSDDQRFNQTRFLAFHFISLLFRIGLIKKISIYITDENDNQYSINDLSEGEQQLIILDSINKVLCRDNSVLFLDEPDAYLHPQRQRELIPYLRSIFSESHTQIISTTHSPFVAQSVPIDSMLIFSLGANEIIYPELPIASYPAISSELFFIDSEFSKLRENELNKFMDFKKKILDNQDIDKDVFKKLIIDLMQSGSELEVIIARELNQLSRLRNFKL